jgi:hypothetical protein
VVEVEVEVVEVVAPILPHRRHHLLMNSYYLVHNYIPNFHMILDNLILSLDQRHNTYKYEQYLMGNHKHRNLDLQ